MATPPSEPEPLGQSDRRAERVRRALERRRQPPRYDRPVWRTLAPGFEEERAAGAPSLQQVERWRPRDQYADRHSEAEYAFYRLPGRFHRYAAEYLFATERILAFVPWTAEMGESWLQRAGRLLAPGGRQVPEGALVVTDRQVLLLRDDEAPVAGTVFWGYTVHATTPERLGAVARRAESGGRMRLRLYLQALAEPAARAAGSEISGEIVEWLFPAGAAEPLDEAIAVLRRFLPQVNDTRLRRLGTIEPLSRLVVAPKPPPAGRRRASLEVETAPEQRAALEAALVAVLARLPAPDGAPRRVRAQALVPAAGPRQGPRLVALTQAHLLVVPLPEEGTPQITHLPAVTSAELQHSPLGYHIAWTVAGSRPLARPGTPGAPRRHVIAFPMPAYPQFFAVFGALRQALTLLPARAMGPDLPEGVAMDARSAGSLEPVA